MAQECDVCGREREGKGKGKWRKGTGDGKGVWQRAARNVDEWLPVVLPHYRALLFKFYAYYVYAVCVIHSLPVAVDRHAFEPGPCLMLFWRRHINRKAGPELKDRKCAPPGTFYVNVLAFVCLLSSSSSLSLLFSPCVCVRVSLYLVFLI